MGLDDKTRAPVPLFAGGDRDLRHSPELGESSEIEHEAQRGDGVHEAIADADVGGARVDAARHRPRVVERVGEADVTAPTNGVPG